jgi:hypothetical protein
VPEVYDELRKLARARLARERRPHQTLQPTALVHEAYLRVSSQPRSGIGAVISLPPPRWRCGASWWSAPVIIAHQARRRRRARRGRRAIAGADPI